MGDRNGVRNDSYVCGRILIWVIVLMLVAVQLAAAGDLTLFGPKHYDRLQGAPTVYTETFDGCSEAGTGLLQVWNGDAKATRITAAEIFVNGIAIFAENEFKKQTAYLERKIATVARNELRIVLKSGDYKEPAFLRLAIIGLGCDSSPPSISAPTPAPGALFATARPRIAAHYGDPSGIDLQKIRLVLDGIDITAAATVENSAIDYQPAGDLSDGAHAVVLDAVDTVGNVAQLVWSFSIDTVPPTITVAAPAAGSVSPWLDVQLTGSLSEVADLTVNGQAAALDEKSFSIPLTIRPGENLIELSAVDRAGNVGRVTLKVYGDSTPPLVTLTAPVNGALTNTASIVLSGSVDEPSTVTFGGATLALSDRSFVTIASLVDGENTLVVSAVDTAGNVGTAPVTVTLDTRSPTVTLNAPLAGSAVNTPIIAVSGQIDEPVQRLTINGRAVTPQGLTFSLADLALAEGENLVRVEAIDLAGNAGTATWTIILDTVVPRVAIVLPLAGTLLATDTTPVRAEVDVDAVTAAIDGQPVPINSGEIDLAAWPLAEGENTLVVSAVDAAGNRGQVAVTVTRDTTPPAPPHFDVVQSPTRVPQLILAGTSTPDATVLLTGGNGTYPALATADAAGRFVFAETTLVEGENRFGAVAIDAAGNRSPASAPLVVVLDTLPPHIGVTAPSAGALGNVSPLPLSGVVDDPDVTLTVAGVATAVAADGRFSAAVALQPGRNLVVLRAVDRLGNTAETTHELWFDDRPPQMTIVAPQDGIVTRSERVTISGTVDESAEVTLDDLPVTLHDHAFIVEVAPVEGENLYRFTAIDGAGNRGTATVSIHGDRTPPTLDLEAPAGAAAGETVTLRVTASDATGVALVEAGASAHPFWAQAEGGATCAATLAYTLPPELTPGSVVAFTLRGVDSVGNSAVATASLVVSAGPSGPGYLQGEVYDDRAGLPLGDVAVAVTGTNAATVTAMDGAYLFELTAGDYRLATGRDGHTTVYREVEVHPERTVAVLDARLTRLADAVGIGYSGGRLSAPFEAGTAWGAQPPPALTVDIPEGALAETLETRLTPLSNQGLPAPLPRGWSPLGAFDLRFTAAGAPLPSGVEFFFPAVVHLPLGASGPVAGDELVVARYDVATGRWRVVGTAVVGSDGAAVAELTAEGGYAFLLADPAPQTPPTVTIGTLLGAAASDDTLADRTVVGEVAPPAAPPTLNLRAVGELRLHAETDPSGPGPASGLVLRGRVTEAFDLLSGDAVRPADFIEDLVLYRSPCATGAGSGRLAPLADEGLRTSFPITPSHQYTIAELLQGEVGIEIVPPETTAAGVLVGPNGAQLLSADGIGLTLPAGALERTVPVQLRTLEEVSAALVPSGYTVLHALRLDLSRQTLTTSANLSLPQPAGFDPTRPVVLVRVFTAAGGEHLRAVAVLRPVGSLLVGDTAFAGLALPGLRDEGIYYVLQSAAPLGVVHGTVRNAAGTPFVGALVAPAAGGLASLSAASGHYLLLAPLGAVRVVALDPARYDRGEASGTLASALLLDPFIRATVPTVVDLSPEPGAVQVEPTAKVVVTFSEPVDRTSVGSATLRIVAGDGTPVDGVFSFSPDATVVSFYPAARLASEGAYRVEIDGFRDLQGYAVVPFAASFTVRDTTPPPLPPAGSITATYPDDSGMIDVIGTQGSAEPGSTVLIVNDSSGEIVAVAPRGDGSFSARIAAQPGDEVRVELMDAAGNITPTAWLTFRAPDGRTLVTARGGRVDGEGGVSLDIPAGALVGPTVVKIVPVTEAGLPHPLPSQGKFVAAVNIDTGGIPFQKEVKLSVPAPDPLPREGSVYVVEPKTHANPDASEEQVFVVHDSTKIVDGRLTCASPPYVGIYGFGLFVFVDFSSFPRVGTVYGTTYRDMNDDNVYSGNEDLPVEGAVIRCAAAQNFISYSGKDGRYAATVFDDTGACAGSPLTAMHPMTMQKVTSYASACLSGPAAQRDLKLADRGTQIIDNTPPAITLGLRVVPGQTENPQLIAGTVPVGTELEVPISLIDQGIKAAYLVLTFQTPAMGEASTLTPPNLIQGPPVLHTPMSGTTPALYRYDYQPRFTAPLDGSAPQRLRLTQAGTYRLTVEAVDASDRRAVRTMQVRAINRADSITSLDGPPAVDALLPTDGAVDVMVTTAVTVWFNEPLDDASVTPQSFRLIDTASETPVPAHVYTSVEGGRMLATLTPLGNLSYGRQYRIELTDAVRDVAANTTGDVDADGRLHLTPFTATFTTKVPRVFDLTGNPFTASRDIDLFTLNDGSGRTFAAVAAGWSGWRLVEVTDPTQPTVVYSYAAPPNWTYRGVAIDPATGMLGVTLDIYSGYRYGYVHFYSLLDPAKPVYAGRELLASTNTGIPGRLDLADNYAYIATVGAGIQVVDVAQATADTSAPSRGNFIVGGFNSAGQGYGEPNDVQVYAPGRMLATTNGGHLLLLGIAAPQAPLLSASWKPATASVSRAAAVGGYTYNDAAGNPAVLDLALAGLSDGRVVTLDLSDPNTPKLLGEAVNDLGVVLAHANGTGVFVGDIALNKEAGLAFTAGALAINVFDIKDPTRPKLLSVIAQLPDANGNLVPLGSTRALVEQGGWVYLANEASGMRVLDLDPVYLQSACVTDENTNMKEMLCNSFYPELGKLTIPLRGFDSTGARPLERPAKVTISNLDELKLAGIEVSFKNGSEHFDNGIARAYLKTLSTFDGNDIVIRFEVDPNSLLEENSQYYTGNTHKVTLRYKVRRNGDVSLQEVLNGTAIYTFASTCSEKNRGKTTGGTPDKQGFDYVQMMINHILPPLRSPVDERNLESLVDADGCYGGQTERALKAIINGTEDAAVIRDSNYKSPGGAMVLDTKVAHDRVNDNKRFQPGTFGKLTAYYTGLTSDNYGKVIDKELLVGLNLNLNVDKHPLNNEDVGIYELYQNDDWDCDGLSNYIEVENGIDVITENLEYIDKNNLETISVERGHYGHNNGTDVVSKTTGLVNKSLRTANSDKGYYYYRSGDKNNSDNYATLRMLQAIEAIGRDWAVTHPDLHPLRKDDFVRDGAHGNLDVNNDDGVNGSDISAEDTRTEVRFGVGDISRKTGGVFLRSSALGLLNENIDDHESHQNGLGADVRFIRNDNTEGSLDIRYKNSEGAEIIDESKLDLTRTIELINLFFAHGASRVIISQATGVNRADFNGNSVSFDSSHDDHFHVDFPIENRPVEVVLELLDQTLEGNYRVRINSRDQLGFSLIAFTVTSTGGRVAHRNGTPSSNQLIEAARYEGTSIDGRTFSEDYVLVVYPNQPGQPVTVNVEVYQGYGVSGSITLGVEE